MGSFERFIREKILRQKKGFYGAYLRLEADQYDVYYTSCFAHTDDEAERKLLTNFVEGESTLLYYTHRDLPAEIMNREYYQWRKWDLN